MKELFASPVFGLTGLIFFFIFFIGVVIWVFRPGSKKKYEQDAQIPLKERNDE
ncbi:MAG: cbb3-type cytochrome c oxidase subunit 3 [Alphaproteobacteria bacterium]|nr:cbb3-type cytochrome c oxidase subunit 3 [Alphaproteobacteria bacterium]MCD8525960.1 cbb3-type cytochrome c oxidase subunit 3 [Alphaproteobacteria bacterium]MCD8570898.1 cbb3-type cytochrome c oxidase subunit 3 [Alphaproteobacteria bacterium]